MVSKRAGATLKQLITLWAKQNRGKFNETSTPIWTNHAEDINGHSWALEYTFAAMPTHRKSKNSGPTNRRYKTVIQFFDIDFKREPDKQHYFKIEVLPKRYRYINLPSLSKTTVRVSCSCPDYYWTFWYQNDKKNAYAGDDPKAPKEITGRETRKTDDRPYGTAPARAKKGQPRIDPRRNPTNSAGLCKHIKAMADRLMAVKKLTQ